MVEGELRISDHPQHTSIRTTESNRFEGIQTPSIERNGAFGLSVNGSRAAHPDEGLEAEIAIDGSEAAFAWDHEIRIDRGDQISGSIAPTSDVRFDRTATIGLLLLIGGGLGWIGVSNLGIPGVSPTILPMEQVNHSISTPDLEKLTRMETPVPSTGLAPSASGIGRAHVPRTTNSVSLAKKQSAPAVKSAAVEQSNVAERRVPVPETRPTTIDGWTVREVNGGTALLEGPNGIWKASAGDIVPGVGKIESVVRWGNRWIVATSRGLISTR